MEITHRIGLWIGADEQAELRQLGIDVAHGFVGIDVSESAPNWSDVEAWIGRRRPSDVVSTAFTADEIAAAPWLSLNIDQHQGFPQPRDDDFGYREATYDTSAYCETCGIGLHQNASFQMKGDPNMGRRGLLQMHWVYDEYFATPGVWETVFRPFGVGSRPVTKPSGSVLEKVVQLVNDEVVPVHVAGLGPARGDELVCRACGRPKYGPVVRGPLPAPLVEPRGHLARSAEWFGSGASAHNQVLVSRALAAALVDAGVRGASLVPATRTS
jgi:hypothetical protein